MTPGTRAVPPRAGLDLPPGRAAASPRVGAAMGTVPLPRPLPRLDPAELLPSRRGCCSACYHLWVVLSRRMTQTFVPGTCLHGRGGRSTRERGRQRGGHAVPRVPPSTSHRGSAAPLRAGARWTPPKQCRAPGEGHARALTGRRWVPQEAALTQAPQVAIPPPSRVSPADSFFLI